MSISEAVLHSNEFKKFKNISSEAEAKELARKTDDEMKNLITTNATHEKEVDVRMKENDAYRRACETKKEFEAAKREKLKSTKLSTALAVLVLHERKQALRGTEAAS